MHRRACAEYSQDIIPLYLPTVNRYREVLDPKPVRGPCLSSLPSYFLRWYPGVVHPVPPKVLRQSYCVPRCVPHTLILSILPNRRAKFGRGFRARSTPCGRSKAMSVRLRSKEVCPLRGAVTLFGEARHTCASRTRPCCPCRHPGLALACNA